MSADAGQAPPDECYRCGYNLTGIANDQACPECGLLAERSRHVTDELHDTRPCWLRRLATGVYLIFLALPASVVSFGVFLGNLMFIQIGGGNALAALIIIAAMEAVGPLLLLAGVILLTAKEGCSPADQADAMLRRLLRWAAVIPLLAMLLALAQMWFVVLVKTPYSRDGWSGLDIIVWLLVGIGGLSLPILLFERLRGLAKRARSAHLAEHCRIVGIGATLSVLYIGAVSLILQDGNDWFGTNWSSHSKIALILVLLLLTAAILFFLWSHYLLIRFAFAFHIASRKLRRQWSAADRSMVDPINP